MHRQTSSTPVRANRRRSAEAGISLTTRRRWFTQNDGQQNGGNGNEAGSSSAATKNTEIMISKDRFDEVNDRMKNAETALKKFQDDTAAAEAERLRKQGEWQQIAENEKKRAADLEGKAARAEALEKMLTESNTARIARVPEADRGLIPVDYPPERLSAWLDANWERLTATRAPDLDAGAGGGGSGGSVTLTAEEKEMARKTGMTDAEFIAARAKLQRSS